MNRDILTPVNQDALLETLAAELTLAAYRVALADQDGGHLARSGTGPLADAGRHGPDVGGSNWLDPVRQGCPFLRRNVMYVILGGERTHRLNHCRFPAVKGRERVRVLGASEPGTTGSLCTQGRRSVQS